MGNFYKNTLILTFEFYPPGPGGTPGALGVGQINKFHKTKSYLCLILVGVPFMKSLKFQIFGCPLGQPCLPAPFSRAMGQKSNFCSQHFFTSSSHFQKGVTRPPCPKTLGGDGLAEKSIFWVWAGSKLHVQKLHAMSQVDPENLTTI